MRGKTIYTKPILSVLWSVMRRKKLKNNETNVCNVMRVKTNLYKNQIERTLVCYEGNNMNTAMHKNVIICTLIFQSISFESALNTLLFPAVLKLRQTWPLFLVSLLNAISFKHTTQASLTAQNPHTSTTGLQNSTSYLSKNKRKSTLSPHQAA